MIGVDKFMLLAQLADGLEQGSSDLEAAYEAQDKKKFDRAKAVILDFQGKINFLLKEADGKK